jgi:hypothetical protein
MSARALYRLSGGALIIGSVLILISSVLNAVLFPGHETSRQQLLGLPWLLVTLITLSGSLLFVIGLPGMYLRAAGRAGVLGLVGFILLFFALLLQGAAFSTMQLVVLPWLAQQAPQLIGGDSAPPALLLLLISSGLMQIVGAVLLGVAAMRAQVFPRWAGGLLIASGIALLLTLPLAEGVNTILEPIAFTLFALAFLRCGYTLMTGSNDVVEAAPRAIAEVQASR